MCRIVRIEIRHEQRLLGLHNRAGRKIERQAAIQPENPVGVEQWHRGVQRIPNLHKLERRRIGKNCRGKQRIEHHLSDQRRGHALRIRRSRRPGCQRQPIRRTIGITSPRRSVFLSLERHRVRDVTGRVCRQIAQEHFVAPLVQSKAVRRRVEITHLIEHQKSVRRYSCAEWNLILLQISAVVAQIPTRRKHKLGRQWIVQLDPIVGVGFAQEVGMRHNLVQERTAGRNCIHQSRRAPDRRTRAPISRVIQSSRRLVSSIRVKHHETVPATIRRLRPVARIAVSEIKDDLPRPTCFERQLLSRIAQAARVRAGNRRPCRQPILRAETGKIIRRRRLHHQQVLQRLQQHSGRERVIHSRTEVRPFQIKRLCRTRVPQFDKLKLRSARRIIHQLGQAEIRHEQIALRGIADGELVRRRPVARAPRHVGELRPHAIGPPHFHHSRRNLDVRDKVRRRLTQPRGVNLVRLRLRRIKSRHAGITHFGDAPPHFRKRRRSPIIAAIERQAVERVVRRPGVSDQRPCRYGRVQRAGIENIRAAIVHIILHQLNAAIEVFRHRRFVGPLVIAPLSRLAA